MNPRGPGESPIGRRATWIDSASAMIWIVCAFLLAGRATVKTPSMPLPKGVALAKIRPRDPAKDYFAVSAMYLEEHGEFCHIRGCATNRR